MSNFIEERKKSRHKNNTYSQPLKVSEIFEKRKAEKSLGLDTLSTDLSTLNTTIQGIYGGWQTPETMAKLRPDVENMYNRLLAYQEYENKYAPKPNVDFRTTFDDLGVPLSQRASYKNPADYVEKTRKMKTAALVEAYNPEKWDTLTETYGGFKNADAYNNMMKTAKFDEKFGGLSFDAVQKEKAKYSPDSDEYKYLDTYTAYSNLGDFEKAIGVEKPKQDALDTIAKYESDIEGYRNGVNNSTGRARQEYQKKLSDTESALSKYLADQGYASVDEAKKSVASNYDSLSRARNKYKTEHGTYDLYGDVVNGKDFAENSKYVSTKGNYSSGWEKFTEGQYGMGYGDLTYEYINNVNGIREDIERSASAYGMNSGSGISSMQKKSYDKLNPEEVALYNALYKEDKENGTNKAQQFLEEMEVTLSKRTYDEDTKRWKDASDSVVGGILTSALSVPANIMGGFTGGIEAIKDKVSGKEYNPYSYYKTPTNFASDTRQYVGENIAEATEGFELFGQNIPSFLYQTAMSMADSTVGAYTMGTAFTPIMGSTAFQQKAKEMHEAGESEDVIFSTALMSGVAEALFEYVSIDKLLKIKDIDSFRGIVKAGLKQAGIEASEEVFTEIANIMSDTIIRGDNSEYMQMYTDLIKRGYSDKEASTEVAKKIGGNIAWAGVGGFLSGGGMGTFHSVGNYNENKSTGSSIRSNEQIDTTLDVIKNMTPQEADAYKTYEQYAKKGVTADNITDAQLGNLYNSARTDAYDTIVSRKSTDEQRQSANKVWQKLNEVDKENTAKKNATAKTTKQKESMSELAVGEVTEVTSTGNSAQIEGIKVDGDSTTLVTNEGEISVDDMTFNQRDSELVGFAQQIARESGNDVANVFLAQYDGKSDVEAYANSFNLVTEYTSHNFTQDTILENRGVLSTEQVTAIYNATVHRQFEAQDKAIQDIVARQSGKTFVKGEFNDSIIDYNNTTTDGSKVNWNSLTSRQKSAVKFARLFSKATGVNIRFIQSTVEDGKRVGENGSYNPNTNTIEIDVYAGIVNAKSVNDSIIPTLSHEVTHWAKAKAPAIYEKLRNEVMSTLADNSGVTSKDRIEAELKRLREAHPNETYTEEDAIDELVAKACEDMLTNSNSIRKMLNKMTAKEQKTFLAKIKETFANLMEWINDLLGQYKSDSIEAKTLREYKYKLQQISKTWDSMVESAIVSNQALQNEGVIGERLGKAVSSVMDTIEQFGIEKLTELAKAQDENGKPLFQYRAIVEDEDTYRQMLLAHKDAIGITEADINALFNLVDEAVKIVEDNLEVLDYAWETDINDRAFMPVKPNSDSEVARILRDNNITPPKRQGGEKSLKDLGLEQYIYRDYSYDKLVAKGNLKGVIVKNNQQVKLTGDGSIDVNWVVNEVRKKCKSIQTHSASPTYYVEVHDIGKNVEINGKDIKHGFIKSQADNGKNVSPKSLLNARVSLELPDVLKNSIEVNRSVRGGNPDVPYSHIMLGTVALEDANGSLEYYAVRLVVEERINRDPILAEAEILGRLHAINTKKIDSSTSKAAKKNSVARLSEKVYIYNIADLLENVKSEFDDTFSEDVYNTLGVTRTYNDFSKYLQYSDRDSDYLSAVERGNIETAQRMVDEAAKKSGYDKKMFHETDAENIHVFDISRGDHGGTDSETPYGIFTKTSDKNIGLGSRQMALYVKAKNTLYVENRADVKNKIPELIPYYDEIARLDEKYDALIEEYEDAELEALENWLDENPDVDMDEVYPTSYIAEGKPADIDSQEYLDAHNRYNEVKAEWESKYNEIAIKCKEIITLYLRNNNYDSMYFKIDGGSRGRETDSLIVLDSNQVKSADPVVYDDNGNVIPLSQRFDSSKDDIRYSDRQQSIPTDEIYDLMGENEKLKKREQILTDGITRLRERLKMEGKETDGQYFSDSTLNNLAVYIKRKFNSTIDKKYLADMLRELTGIIKNLNDSGMSSDTFYKEHLFPVAYAIAEQIETNDIVNEEANAILKAIRDEKIVVSENQISDLKNAYGSHWNRAFFGKLHVSKGSRSNVDEVYARLRKDYPSVFPEVMSDADMLPNILDAYNRLKDAMYIEQEFNVHEVSMEIAQEIYSQCWTLKPTKTIADRYADKIKKLNAEHNKAMKELKETYEDRADRRKLADDMYYGRRMHELGKEKTEAVAKQRLADDMYYSRIINNIRRRDEMALDLAKKKGKEKLDKYKENALRKTILQRITANVLGLSRKLIKNSKDEHVPEIMKPIIVELVQALDFSSKRMLDKGIPTQKDISLYKALSKVNGMITKANAGNEAYAELAGIISDEDFESLTESALYIRDELGDNDGILNNMTTEQLERLDHVVRAIKHVVVKANEFYIANHSKGIADLSRKSIDDMGALDKAKKFEEGSVVGGTVKMLNWKNIIPTYAFKRFGEGGRIVFTALQDGWDKFAYNIKTIIDTTNKTYTDKEVEDWGQKVETFEITEPISDAEKDNPDYKPNKITLRMTVAQIMSLYCLNKREQARGHLLGGGIRVADFKGGTKVISQTDSVILTDGIIEEIIGRLTDRQKAVADMLQEFMNTVCSDWGNEVSMLRFGYNAFGEENYFPIQSDENNLAVNDATDNQNSLFRLLNMSFAKTLTDNANNTIIISDIFDVFAQHSTDMAKYNALALPVLDAFKWYNYVEKQDKGDIEGNKAHKTKSVKEAMEKAFGNDAKSYFTTFLRDINGTQNVSRDTLGNGFFKNAKIASVGANLRVVLLQPTSYLRASAVIDSKYLTRALAHKPKSADAIKHCGIALWKSLGFYDTNVQRGVEELIKHEQTKKDKAIEWAMKGAEVADRITWGYLWNACELEIRDTRKDLEIGSKEFFEAISKRLREVIYATQVVDSTMTRSEMMRSSDRLDKVLTAFASEPTLSYNMLYDAYMELHLDARKYGKKEAWNKNGKRVARIVYAYTITNAMAALVEAGFDAFRDDDEEEKDLAYFMRLYLTNFASDMSITGKIPYVKELHSILKGFSSSRTDTQWMESSMRAVKEWIKIFSGEGNPSKVAKNSIKAFSDFTGLPIYNVYRDVNASLDLLTGEDLGDMFNDFFE